MSEPEIPKTKRQRSAPKSFAAKVREMADAKRKQVAKLKKRHEDACERSESTGLEYARALDELNKLEVAAGAAS